jgi:hypothetical protein
VDELSFFSISIGTYVNILVAVGTLLMAYCTYVAVKTSQKQFLILRREKEKPLAFDQIQNVFNVIQNDIARELDAIRRVSLSFPLSQGNDHNDDNPLVFPVANKKQFYSNFRTSFCGESIQSNKQIPGLIDSIERNLAQRLTIYQSLTEKLSALEREIDTKYIDPHYQDLLGKFPGITVIPVTETSGSYWKVLRDKREVQPFLIFMMRHSISNIILAKIVQSEDDAANRTMSYITDLLLNDLQSYIKNLVEQTSDENILKMKEKIIQDLKTLEYTDESISNQIQEIKGIYRDMFLLIPTELEPPKNTW